MENISKEDIKYLQELSKKMNAQDNRATQFVMFVVKQKVKVYGREGCCSETERHPDQEYEGVCSTCRKKWDKDEDVVLPDYCCDCDDECFLEFNWEDETVENLGTFFTAEAAQRHIDANYYHYNKPFVYGIGSWRNSEMQNILRILSSLENGEPKSCYN